jgi:cytoskeletal protein RodZ
MPETIGQHLKRVRETKGLTIQTVVNATHIRAPHLEALEADDFESLPSPVQARAFLRLYAEYLGISLEQIISYQRATIGEFTSALLNTTLPSIQPVEGDATGEEPGPVNSFMIRDKLKFLLNPDKQKVSLRVSKPATAIPAGQGEPSGLPDPTDGETEELSAMLEENPSLPIKLLQSQLILNSIGFALRQRRESLSLTLEEIERHTHIRKHYLQALEAGEFDLLPSSVQARGILNNYARFLDLDVDELLLQYADSLQIQRVERQSGQERTPEKPGNKFPVKLTISGKLPDSLRRYLSLDVVVGGGLILLLLVFAVWGTSRILNLRSETTQHPTAPSISLMLGSSSESMTPTPSPTTAGTGLNNLIPPAGETPVLTLPPTGQGVVNVVVIAEQQAWVRVTVDGKVAFEGRVTAGTAYPYDGNIQIEVLTGNGIAISILYNESNLGPMGNLGEVVDRIYTSKAILVPTSTFTPTPSTTLTPSITLRPSVTLRPSSTPRPFFTPTP